MKSATSISHRMELFREIMEEAPDYVRSIVEALIYEDLCLWKGRSKPQIFRAQNIGCSREWYSKVTTWLHAMGVINKLTKKDPAYDYKKNFICEYAVASWVLHPFMLDYFRYIMPKVIDAILFFIRKAVPLWRTFFNQFTLLIQSVRIKSLSLVSSSSSCGPNPDIMEYYVKNPISHTIKSIPNLTKAEQIQLTAFRDDIINRAWTITSQRRDKIESVFGYLFKTCVNISHSLNLEPDYKFSQQLGETLKENPSMGNPLPMNNEPVNEALKSFTNISKRAEPQKEWKQKIPGSVRATPIKIDAPVDYIRKDQCENPDEVARKLENPVYLSNLKKLMGTNAKVVPNFLK